MKAVPISKNFGDGGTRSRFGSSSVVRERLCVDRRRRWAAAADRAAILARALVRLERLARRRRHDGRARRRRLPSHRGDGGLADGDVRRLLLGGAVHIVGEEELEEEDEVRRIHPEAEQRVRQRHEARVALRRGARGVSVRWLQCGAPLDGAIRAARFYPAPSLSQQYGRRPHRTPAPIRRGRARPDRGFGCVLSRAVVRRGGWAGGRANGGGGGAPATANRWLRR